MSSNVFLHISHLHPPDMVLGVFFNESNPFQNIGDVVDTPFLDF
jgi:hypothetical protein